MLQKIVKVFAEAFVSHNRHTLCLRREWASSDDLHLRILVGNVALIGLDLSLTALISIAGRRRSLPAHKYIKTTRAKA
jgi:hypothetical protein